MQADRFAQLPPAFSVYLARHATPDRANYHLPYHLPPGPPLTERGLEEAAELGQFFLSEGVRHIFCSPLERTLTTATIAGQVAQASVTVQPDLREMCPEESWEGLLERCLPGFQAGAQYSHAHQCPVALVTHGSPVLVLLRWLGLAEAQLEAARIYDWRTPLPPAGAWSVQADGETRRLHLQFVPAGARYPEFMEVVG